MARRLNNYMRLPASVFSVKLTMPAHTNPITQEHIPATDLFNGKSIESLGTGINWKHDRSEFVFGGEFTSEEMFYLAAIGHSLGFDARVMNHSEAKALVTSLEWMGE